MGGPTFHYHQWHASIPTKLMVYRWLQSQEMFSLIHFQYLYWNGLAGFSIDPIGMLNNLFMVSMISSFSIRIWLSDGFNWHSDTQLISNYHNSRFLPTRSWFVNETVIHHSNQYHPNHSYHSIHYNINPY